MKKSLFQLSLTILLAAAPTGAAADGAGTLPPGGGDAIISDLARQVDHDAGRPLDVQGQVAAARESATVYDITYASPNGDRVDAFLVVSTVHGPQPAVLFGR